MNIGLDIDGCLTDLEKFHLNYGIPYFEKKFQLSVADETGKTIRQLFDCSKYQEARFWMRYFFAYSVKDPVRDGAAEFIRWAHENDHKIYIITSRFLSTQRGPVGMLMRMTVKKWLKKSGVHYDDITFCDEDKLPALEKYGVDFMIEDDPDNIKAMQDCTNVICFDARCNQHLEEEYVYRCNSFDEILNFLSMAQIGKVC